MGVADKSDSFSYRMLVQDVFLVCGVDRRADTKS
jgi:hypothetical protein